MSHHKVGAICSSAGIVINSSFIVHQYVARNMKQEVMKMLTETRNKRGRSTDDKRSVVQLIVLVSLPGPDSNRGKTL